MKAIALTGLIGSGKSTVLKTVRRMAVSVIDCDSIVSKLYRDKAVKKKLFKLFGTVNRKKIANIVFSSSSKRKKLEALLHPLVWREVKAKLALFKERKKNLAVVDVPLLFEAKWENKFDSIVFVKAPKAKCLARLVDKGLSIKEALQRWNSQIRPGKKIKKAQHVIDNSGSLSHTRKQARLLFSELKKNG